MRKALAVWWLALGGVTSAGLAPAAGVVPAGFTDSLLASVGLPTAIAFTPDGRALVTTQDGFLRVIQGGSLLGTPALSFPAAAICTSSERGLLGVAVHPNFVANQFLLSPNGSLAVFAGQPGGASVHFILDVIGYFQ